MSEFTHKGWFLLCPVYMDADDRDNPQGMAVAVRWRGLDWWFTVNAWLFDLIILPMTLLDPYYVPLFPFYITGKISNEEY